jgi:ABC-2 type transport system permease protein
LSSRIDEGALATQHPGHSVSGAVRLSGPGIRHRPRLPARLPLGGRFPVEAHGFEVAGFGQPFVILYAALVTGSEFTGGQLRSSLLATPRRGILLAAKLMVITVPTVLLGLISTGASVLIEHAALGDHGLAVGDYTAGMGWNLLGVAVNYTLIALIAGGITVLARSIVVTLVLLVPLVLGLTISLVGVLPPLKFLPDLAGLQLLTGYPGVGLLEPVPGGIVMAGWAALLGGVAWLGFTARDAG